MHENEEKDQESESYTISIREAIKNIDSKCIYKTNFKHASDEDNRFKFIQIRTKLLKKRVRVIQIVDISERVIVNAMKKEKILLTLINATVSHELRNPLQALIGQTLVIEDLFELFQSMIG